MQLAHDHPPLAQRLDDRGRRHRPVHRRLGPRRLGRDPRRSCPTAGPPRREQLTVGYRIPGPNMDLAARVLARSAPDLLPPRSVRQDGRPPRFAPGRRARATWARPSRRPCGTRSPRSATATSPSSARPRASTSARRRSPPLGIDHGVAIEQGLNHQVTVVPVGIVKGLELDATVVVDPAGILAEEAQGMRALYVALTRATKLLTVVHQGDLPDVLAEADAPQPQPVG